MIDGLKLTMPGEELRRLLEQRIHDHERRAARWTRERERTPEQQTEGEPLLPEHMCANEAERHEWRRDVLGFMRDHIDAAEVKTNGCMRIEPSRGYPIEATPTARSRQAGTFPAPGVEGIE